MASFPDENTTDSDSGTESNEEPTESDEQGNILGSPVVQTLAEHARTLADLIAPFSSLLTAVVQAVTVWTLIKNAQS